MDNLCVVCGDKLYHQLRHHVRVPWSKILLLFVKSSFKCDFT